MLYAVQEDGNVLRKYNLRNKSKDSKKHLSKLKGFKDKCLEPKEIDYSGISYDRKRKAFWIVSDKAKRIYLYSWKKDKVKFNTSLKYKDGGEKKTIKKAEGVAYDAVGDRLYIVSDDEARLYVYDVG